MKGPDDNDLLRRGRLPADPAEGARNIGDWGDPISFDRAVQVPAFPVEILPGWLRDMAVGVSEDLQVPVCMPSMIALACCSAAVAGRVTLLVRPGFSTPVNLYVAVFARPSERKSAVMQRMRGPLLRFEREEQERAAPGIRSARAVRAALEAKVRKLTGEIERAEGRRADELGEALRKAITELEAHPVPTIPRLLCDDATKEAFVSLMAENNGRIAILTEEGGVFDQMSGRYSEKGALDPYLKAWSGDPIMVDRKSRDPESIDHPTLTLGVLVQPRVLATVLGNKDFALLGLVSRFLFSVPVSKLGRRDVDPKPLDPATRDAYESRLLNLARATFPSGASLTLSPSAFALRTEFAARLEPRLGEDGDLGDPYGWSGKLEGNMLRVCALLHLAEHSCTQETLSMPICEATIQRAITFADYAIAHAKAALDGRTVDPLAPDARYMLDWIRKKGRAELSLRDLHQGVRSRFPRKADLDPVIQLLVDYGYLRWAEAAAGGGRGRPPSPVLRVHPGWLRGAVLSEPSKHSNVDL